MCRGGHFLDPGGSQGPLGRSKGVSRGVLGYPGGSRGLLGGPEGRLGEVLEGLGGVLGAFVVVLG